jgi:hypothetical protein
MHRTRRESAPIGNVIPFRRPASGWIRRFILFNGKRHPDDMAEPEVSRFLSALATEKRVAASTQNQAFAAVIFLYHEVLGRDLDWLRDLLVDRGHLGVQSPLDRPRP